MNISQIGVATPTNAVEPLRIMFLDPTRPLAMSAAENATMAQWVPDKEDAVIIEFAIYIVERLSSVVLHAK